MKEKVPARLVLEDGAVFQGISFGRPTSAAGEVVFSTGMTGYPQSLTDPSYRGQILVLTYPLVGNYGIPVHSSTGAAETDRHGIPLHFESGMVQVSGLVVSEACGRPSHYASGASLSDWMEASGVPGLAGVDTRRLTMYIRERGTPRGKIVVDKDIPFDAGVSDHPVAEVSPRSVQIFEADSPGRGFRAPRIALVDCGAKANLLRCLLARGATVIRLPWDHDLSGIEYDGLLLSNGPGDPKACARTIAAVRKALARGRPIFGICLGNQILALAAGADTYKLPFGHRGQNQPCVEAGTDRCHITSQNHGYAVKAETLPRGWTVWFSNANDGTVEGIRSEKGPFSAVQFHPEGSPGPRDCEYLLDDFIDQVRNLSGLRLREAPAVRPALSLVAEAAMPEAAS
ncbi:MAG TPA: glutamine-hydrolyzing carbamoyl-phosphate synthase small subunit [Magnetospirillaceae bacterium]|nr:glutamine-hydrolyzing carbamoyl-phosphate synthase small subunit [Magnetospirillaceae bacterium]